MPKPSAGLLMYRYREGLLQVLPRFFTPCKQGWYDKRPGPAHNVVPS